MVNYITRNCLYISNALLFLSHVIFLFYFTRVCLYLRLCSDTSTECLWSFPFAPKHGNFSD